jgi:hypothetical protein
VCIDNGVVTDVLSSGRTVRVFEVVVTADAVETLHLEMDSIVMIIMCCAVPCCVVLSSVLSLAAAC